MELKIGRHIYEITPEDRFMDNGACVMLLTQSKEKQTSPWHINSPRLSKKAIKEIDKYEYEIITKTESVTVFRILEDDQEVLVSDYWKMIRRY
jgi:hypothetical protein